MGLLTKEASHLCCSCRNACQWDGDLMEVGASATIASTTSPNIRRPSGPKTSKSLKRSAQHGFRNMALLDEPWHLHQVLPTTCPKRWAQVTRAPQGLQGSLVHAHGLREVALGLPGVWPVWLSALSIHPMLKNHDDWSVWTAM